MNSLKNAETHAGRSSATRFRKSFGFGRAPAEDVLTALVATFLVYLFEAVHQRRPSRGAELSAIKVTRAA